MLPKNEIPVNTHTVGIAKKVDRTLNTFILYEFSVSTSHLFQRISFIL